MADSYQIETSADRYLLEDASGVLLLEGAEPASPQVLEFRVPSYE